MAGASPETLVKLEDGVLNTFPLAGTRPRGRTEAEDMVLEKELLADEKELAEHNMLVDLGRNDIGRISRLGTVEVEKYLSIERYSHVMHIGSTVRGEIREDCDALDAVSAVLPAGTLSGAPKIRACQLIGELVRENTDIPCAIGFGISTPEQAAKMAGISDGAIVGSAIIKILEKYGKDAPVHIGEYVKSMKDAVCAAG